MTAPAPATKPKRCEQMYLISASDVSKLEYHSPYGWGSDIAKRVRSHPAPAADAPNQCYHTGYSDGAQKERENVIEILCDLNKYSCFEYEEANLSDNEREMRIHLEYANRLWGIIRSLRSTNTKERAP